MNKIHRLNPDQVIRKSSSFEEKKHEKTPIKKTSSYDDSDMRMKELEQNAFGVVCAKGDIKIARLILPSVSTKDYLNGWKAAFVSGHDDICKLIMSKHVEYSWIIPIVEVEQLELLDIALKFFGNREDIFFNPKYLAFYFAIFFKKIPVLNYLFKNGIFFNSDPLTGTSILLLCLNPAIYSDTTEFYNTFTWLIQKGATFSYDSIINQRKHIKQLEDPKLFIPLITINRSTDFDRITDYAKSPIMSYLLTDVCQKSYPKEELKNLKFISF